MTIRRLQRGSLLLSAVALIVMASLLVAALTFLTVGSLDSSSRNVTSAQALFVAESGVERATGELLAPTLVPARATCAGINGAANFTNAVEGMGRFTVTTTGPTYLSSPLVGGIVAGATAIPLTSAAGFPASGRVMIDREFIDYNGIVGNTLQNAVRGADGTLAAAHANLTRVAQYQCSLTARGGVPDLATIGHAERILYSGTQLKEGWAVGVAGAAAAQRPLFAGWNRTASQNAWSLYNSAALNINAQLNNISMLSYADGWAVGNPGAGATRRPLILSWNGSAWTTRNSSLNINRALNGIYCNSATDCWAVGQNGGAGATQRPLILWWNGATWATRNSSLNINRILYGIHCNSATDCWAVGQNGGAGATQRPLILWWNGATWATRNSSLNINQTLNGIHCLTANDCWAVGNAGTRLHWDGAAWTAVNVPAIAQALRGVNMVGAPQRPKAVWQELFP